MRVPDVIRECVCYICIQIKDGPQAGQYHPIGTAFLVGVSEFGYQFCYVVTARHVLDEARRGSHDWVHLRLNTQDDKVDYVEVPVQGVWHEWDSPVVDLVAVHIPIPGSRFQITFLPLSMFVTNKELEKFSIGPGDDVFITGLFRYRKGRRRNFPIMRSGIIAGMPEELMVDSKTGAEHWAYLLEVRSIAGLSGSPVFVYLDKNRRPPPPDVPEDQGFIILLLGIIRGHWEMSPYEYTDADSSGQASDVELGFSKAENMNVGIAMVTPAHYLWFMLHEKGVVAMRKQIAARLDASEQEGLVEDAAATSADHFRESDFETALKLASRKTSEPDPETKETSE